MCLQILLTQQQLMKAKSDEENKGGGAADARRWNGLRNVVESRALLKTAFRTASTLKAQVQDIHCHCLRKCLCVEDLELCASTRHHKQISFPVNVPGCVFHTS